MARLKRARDGHYYIRRFVHGPNQNATYQVTQEGVAWLRSCGVSEDDQFADTFVDSLLQQGMVFTQGSGLSGQSLTIEPRDDRVPLLSLRIDEGSWTLGVLFPELPAHWEPDARTLSRCSFRIDRTSELPSIRLWPGKGGAIAVVLPKERNYKVTASGSWPSQWDLKAWTGEITGLDPKGTFFDSADNQGIRLEPGKQIALGTSYYIVVKSSEAGLVSNAITHPPREVRVVRLARNQGWEAWELEIPNVPNDALREWCLRIRHPVQEPAWRVALLSPPPHNYTVYGIPCIELGQKMNIASYPPKATANQFGPATLTLEHIPDRSEKPRVVGSLQVSREALFASPPIGELGTYRIRAITGQAIPLTFRIIARNPVAASWRSPVGLKLVIQRGSEKTCLSAFEDGYGPHEFVISNRHDEHLVSVATESPVPVQLSWGGKKRAEIRTGFEASRILDAIGKDLAGALENRKPLAIELDARNYGRLSVHFLPTVLAASVPVTFSKKALDLARWLEVVLPHFVGRAGQILVPLPAASKLALKKIEGEFPILGKLHSVPKPLISQILALAQELSR